MLGPATGLSLHPVIELPAGLEQVRGSGSPVTRYATGQPLAWLDDDFDVYPAAREAFLDRRRAVGLSIALIGVNPRERGALASTWRRSQPGRSRRDQNNTSAVFRYVLIPPISHPWLGPTARNSA